MISSSRGSRPTLADPCGTRVSNSAASPALRMKSWCVVQALNAWLRRWGGGQEMPALDQRHGSPSGPVGGFRHGVLVRPGTAVKEQDDMAVGGGLEGRSQLFGWVLAIGKGPDAAHQGLFDGPRGRLDFRVPRLVQASLVQHLEQRAVGGGKAHVAAGEP